MVFDDFYNLYHLKGLVNFSYYLHRLNKAANREFSEELSEEFGYFIQELSTTKKCIIEKKFADEIYRILNEIYRVSHLEYLQSMYGKLYLEISL